MVDLRNAGQKVEDFLGAENDGQLLPLLGSRNGLFEDPLFMQCDFVEKAESGYSNDDGSGSQFFSFVR